MDVHLSVPSAVYDTCLSVSPRYSACFFFPGECVQLVIADDAHTVSHTHTLTQSRMYIVVHINAVSDGFLNSTASSRRLTFFLFSLISHLLLRAFSSFFYLLLLLQRVPPDLSFAVNTSPEARRAPGAPSLTSLQLVNG